MQKTLMPPPFVPKEKKPEKKYIPALIVISFVSLAAFFVAVFIPEGKNEEKYLQELIEKKEAGVFLASGEEKDYCLLMATLRDSIVLSCLPVLEGVNWERPPKSPDGLGTQWVEVFHKEQEKDSDRRVFVHKDYPKIKIAFDSENYEKADEKGLGQKSFVRADHWHRFNPNSANKKDKFLDAKGLPVSSKNSHILP